jgi:hypothetical protein
MADVYVAFVAIIAMVLHPRFNKMRGVVNVGIWCFVDMSNVCYCVLGFGVLLICRMCVIVFSKADADGDSVDGEVGVQAAASARLFDYNAWNFEL